MVTVNIKSLAKTRGFFFGLTTTSLIFSYRLL